MSYQSDNLDLEILEVGDPADLTTVSDNFEKIDAVAGDIATVETSPTQAAHSVGEFLLYDGRLYKVTSAISAGGSLILGTNVQAANIGSELKSLQDSVFIYTYGIFIPKIEAGARGHFSIYYSKTFSTTPHVFLGPSDCTYAEDTIVRVARAYSDHADLVYANMRTDIAVESFLARIFVIA